VSPEEDQKTATGKIYGIIEWNLVSWTCYFRYANKQTDRQTCWLWYFVFGQSNEYWKL